MRKKKYKLICFLFFVFFKYWHNVNCLHFRKCYKVSSLLRALVDRFSAWFWSSPFYNEARYALFVGKIQEISWTRFTFGVWGLIPFCSFFSRGTSCFHEPILTQYVNRCFSNNRLHRKSSANEDFSAFFFRTYSSS